jgi:hypothetical protein
VPGSRPGLEGLRPTDSGSDSTAASTELERLREVAEAALDIPLTRVGSDPYQYRLAVALDALEEDE